MAQKVQVTLVCDLHGNEVAGTETITFGVDGASYEIDVCAEHADELRGSFAGYVGAARRAGRGSGTRARPGRARRGGGEAGRIQDMRDWARKNGHQVSERGRLPASVIAAYQAAH